MHQCHGPKKQKADLRLDSRAALLKGADTGPVVVPGKPGQSALIRSIQYAGDSKMPEKAEKLPETQSAALAGWVRMGAPWPTGDAPALNANLPGVFRTLDFANPDATSPQRHVTTVPQQALFLLNSPFVMDRARGLSGLPGLDALPLSESQIQTLSGRVFARRAAPAEVENGLRFLREQQSPGQSASRNATLAVWFWPLRRGAAAGGL